MSSPRSNRCLAKHTLLLVAVLLAGGTGTPLAAQDTAAAGPADTALARPDSARARPDSAPGGQNGMRPDTARADSVARDTTRPASPGTAGAPASPPPAPQPVDSALAAACERTGGDPPDLLTVVFRSTATAEEREAAAREVGGTLLEPSRHQAPGAWYLQVPNSGIDKSVADRLIMLPPVLEVGATRCPS